jgi:hypothetical protein
MNKILKIILISIVVIIVLFILLLGIGLYTAYREVKWQTEIAEDMGPIILGSPLFNEKLSLCSPAWGVQSIFTMDGESWEIRGLKKNYCIVTIATVKDLNTTYEEGSAYLLKMKISRTGYYCKLSYDIYSNPESITWKNLLTSDSCTIT